MIAVNYVSLMLTSSSKQMTSNSVSVTFDGAASIFQADSAEKKYTETCNCLHFWQGHSYTRRMVRIS